MYLYETHLHTTPVSLCGRATAEDVVHYYKEIGYAGIFITNHFIEGNCGVDRSLPYDEQINYYFSDYEKALEIGEQIGLSVFSGLEMTYGGTDFLVYGLDKAWYLAHPECATMSKDQLLPRLMEHGALVIHAHPFRQASYINHIRLYPNCVQGVEIFNANRSDFDNDMAAKYAAHYGLLPFSGSDNHAGSRQTTLGGMQSMNPIVSEADFVMRVLRGEMAPFRYTPEGTKILT